MKNKGDEKDHGGGSYDEHDNDNHDGDYDHGGEVDVKS